MAAARGHWRDVAPLHRGASVRFGLVGRGPQAARYLEQKNSAGQVVSQVHGRISAADYNDWLGTVDAVIIATHPNGHVHLALAAIAKQKPVIVEKPLALNLSDALRIIGAAETQRVPLEVAHLHLWHEQFPSFFVGATHATMKLTYSYHNRDYSAWLDWGPHVMSALEATKAPSVSWSFNKCDRREFRLTVSDARGVRRDYTGRERQQQTPMLHMLDAFARGHTWGYEFQRRVHRALFAHEDKLNA